MFMGKTKQAEDKIFSVALRELIIYKRNDRDCKLSLTILIKGQGTTAFWKIHIPLLDKLQNALAYLRTIL